MAGREKQKVYHYDRDGSYVRSYDSLSEFAEDYGVQTNIFKNSGYIKDLVKLYDETYASTYRVGRDGIRKYERYHSSEFVGKGKALALGKVKASGKNHRVLVYDLDNELIVTFENIFIAYKFGISDYQMHKSEGRFNEKGISVILEEC